MLIIVRMTGEREALEEASLCATAAVGEPDGLLARAVARTQDGVVLVNLWADEEHRRRANDDPAHVAAIAASGIDDVAVTRTVERHDVLDFTIARAAPPGD